MTQQCIRMGISLVSPEIYTTINIPLLILNYPKELVYIIIKVKSLLVSAHQSLSIH